MKWDAYGKVVGNKYLGEVEAATEQEAIEAALKLDSTYVSFCHQCAGECEDPVIEEVVVEKG